MAATKGKNADRCAAELAGLAATEKRNWLADELDQEGMGDVLARLRRPGFAGYLGRLGLKARSVRKGTEVVFESLAPPTEIESEIVDVLAGSGRVVRRRKGASATIGGVKLHRWTEPPKNAVERPPHFRYPDGPTQCAARWIHRCQIGKRISVYVYGPSGSGKTALGRSVAHDLNYEFASFSFREGSDVEGLLGTIQVRGNETVAELGALALALQGRPTKDGGLRPVFIELDDVDRAPPNVAEVLRQVLDRGAGRVLVPEIKEWIAVHPETVIWATANTAGRGDDSGQYVSAEIQDGSIMARYGRVLEMDYPPPRFEAEVAKNKFPELDELMPGFITAAVRFVSEVRDATRNNNVMLHVGHRELCGFLEEALDVAKGVGAVSMDQRRSRTDRENSRIAWEAAPPTILNRATATDRVVVERVFESHFAKG